MREKVPINEQIRFPELRVIGPTGENFGVITRDDALNRAKEAKLDLIVISAGATPPIAKIIDYGKYQYEKDKKEKRAKANAHSTETKKIQVSVGTSEHDLAIKAKQASGWLKEGHRVMVELYLAGRTKYMDQKFLQERLERVFPLLTENFKIAEEPKRGLRGLAMIIERAK